MGVLGEDGSGYELARRLDESSAWQAWLGDADYELLHPHLSSSAAWLKFMRSEAEHLQLRARALLYDKALGCLFTDSSNSISPTQLDDSYLQLQADDVYFSFERDASDWAKYGLDSSKYVSNDVEDEGSRPFAADSRQHVQVGDCDSSSTGCLWYDQWLEKNLAKRMSRLARRFGQCKLPFGEQDACVRTPEKMNAYVSFSMQAKRRHRLIRLTRDSTIMANCNRDVVEGPYVPSVSVIENDSKESCLSNPPEIMFPGNCIPDNPIPIKRKREYLGKSSSAGILDLLDITGQASTRVNLSLKEKSARRLDVEDSLIFRKENVVAGAEKEKLSEHVARCLVQQTVIRLITAAGLEGLKQGALDILCELFVCHIRKLGRGLRLLLDSYQRHCTPAEILRMYLHTAGGSSSNIRSLIEYLKNEISLLQADQPQQYKSACTQDYEISLLQADQLQQCKAYTQQSSPNPQGPQRQISPQVQFLNQQNLMQQQQYELDKFGRWRQPSNLRSKKFDKDRMLADVKVDAETNSDPLGTPNETKPFVSLISPQSHQQWQQQQTLQMSQPQPPQALQQFKQHISSLQVPSLQQ